MDVDLVDKCVFTHTYVALTPMNILYSSIHI